MPLIETESLVLKTHNLAEADRIVVFLTRDHGVVRGVARGAKRLKSRFGSTLELFSTVELTYFQKEERELVSIQKVDLLRSFFEQAASPEFLDTFSYVADLILQFALPHDPNETLYRMLKACLDSEPESKEDLDAARLYCELWLLRLSGYLPDWSVCAECGCAFAADEPATLRGGFHLHCTKCRKSSGIMNVLPEHRDIFAMIQRSNPVDFTLHAKEHGSAVAELSLIMKRLIANVIGESRRPAPPNQNYLSARDAA